MFERRDLLRHDGEEDEGQISFFKCLLKVHILTIVSNLGNLSLWSVVKCVLEMPNLEKVQFCKYVWKFLRGISSNNAKKLGQYKQCSRKSCNIYIDFYLMCL